MFITGVSLIGKLQELISHGSLCWRYQVIIYPITLCNNFSLYLPQDIPGEFLSLRRLDVLCRKWTMEDDWVSRETTSHDIQLLFRSIL